MRVLRCWTMAGLALAAFAASSSRACAASSYDSCVGFIDVVPAVISTPGNWCLRQHLRTNLTSTNAIEVQSNNVTIDCNGFMLDNQAAGPERTALAYPPAASPTLRYVTARSRGSTMGPLSRARSRRAFADRWEAVISWRTAASHRTAMPASM